MLGRTLVKITASENSFSLKTISRDYRSPQRFVVLHEELEELETKGHLILSDIRSFAELRLRDSITGDRELQITFSWLSNDGYGSLSGRTETVLLPYSAFLRCLEESRGQNGASYGLLSAEKKKRSVIEFESRRNLKEVTKRKGIRRKLGKFLDLHFNWVSSQAIQIRDDFCPYSFFFTEIRENGTGICGGIILHDQENLKKAHYEIHT